MSEVAPTAPRSGRRRRGHLLPGAIALVALAVLAVAVDLVGLQHHSPATLAGPDVETKIGQGIQAIGDRGRPAVSCPASEPVQAGLTFTCEEQDSPGARQRRLLVTEGAHGSFTWRVEGP